MKRTLLIILIFAGLFACKKKDTAPKTPPVVDSNLVAYSLNGLKDLDIADTAVSLPLEIKKESNAQEILTTSVSGLPAGITAVFEPAFGTPNYTSLLKFTPDGTTTTGKYPLTVTLANAAGKKRKYTMNLNVVAGAPRTVTLSGTILSSMTLVAGNKYILKGCVYVGSGATLTIPAGTIIMGEKASKGTLIITRGARIDAQGTASNPIVFTTDQRAGSRSQGDWGGIVILGKAPINPSGGTAKVEGNLVLLSGASETEYLWYGGTDNNDNSGTMKYVRIEFAGIAAAPDNETNGLTLAGVGSMTTLSYIQVYRSGDDAFEWFGGTVNADHLVATYSWDDDFDTDFGYSGKVQFCVAQRAKVIADASGSNGFESDNDGNGTSNTPQTRAVFANMTIVGPITSGKSTSGINANYQNGAHLRRNSAQSIYNSILMGFPYGLYIDDSKGLATSTNTSSGTLNFKGNIIAGCSVAFRNTTSWTGATSWFTSSGTSVLTNVEDAMLSDPFKYSPDISSMSGRPQFTLQSGSPALSGAVSLGISGMIDVPYRGAFDGSNDWTLGWTTWAAESTVY